VGVGDALPEPILFKRQLLFSAPRQIRASRVHDKFLSLRRSNSENAQAVKLKNDSQKIFLRRAYLVLPSQNDLATLAPERLQIRDLLTS
jgi:hypothetical protein